MNIVSYLADIYGYDTPIFLKDVRIGRKSKSAIKEAFYRAVKTGELKREDQGVYYLKSEKEFGNVITFTDVLKKKYFYSDDVAPGFEELFVEGYYSGLTFLNMIGISEQVPAVPEITTNKTSSKKRWIKYRSMQAIVRKARTKVTSQNWKMLQFLDMFHFVSLEEVKENKQLLRDYIKKNSLSKYQFSQCGKYYGPQTFKKLTEGGIIDAFI